MKNTTLIAIGKYKYHQMLITTISKKLVIGILLTALMLLLLGLSGCSSTNNKEEKPNQTNTDVQEKQDAINAETKKEMEEFTQRLQAQITENEKNLSDFNARITKQKGDAKADYEKKKNR